MEKSYSYDFQNQVRDLGDELSSVIEQGSNILRLFNARPEATQRKHEWLEDQITGSRCVVTDTVSSHQCPMSATDLAKLRVGTLVYVEGDTAVFRVTALDTTYNKTTVERVGANGSAKTDPAEGDVLVVMSTPEQEGTTEGENKIHQSGHADNYTQIFRKDIVLSGSALAIATYGIENSIQRQTILRLADFSRDLNLQALRGIPVQPTASVNGAAGGLFYFGTLDGGLSVDAGSLAFDSFVVNDGAQAIAAEGGNPQVIICSIGQARVLSADMNDKVTVVRQDPQRGTFVANVVNDVTGAGMQIFADKAMPDDQAFIVDPDGFGLVALKGRAVWDEDTTPKGFDGIRRTIMGEYTFEFKNAKQRICRVTNLLASATALANKRSGVKKVSLENSSENPIFTREVGTGTGE